MLHQIIERQFMKQLKILLCCTSVMANAILFSQASLIIFGASLLQISPEFEENRLLYLLFF